MAIKTITTTKNGMTTTTKKEVGLVAGLKRVAGVFTAPITGQKIFTSGGKDVTRAVNTATVIGAAGSAAWIGAISAGGAAAGGVAGSAAAGTTTKLAVPAIVAGAAGGVLLGGLFSGGAKATTGDQNTNPNQNPVLNANPNQTTDQPNQTNPNQGSNDPFTVGGSGNIINYINRRSQNTTSYYYPTANPTQTTPIDQTASQSVDPTQSASASSTSGLLPIIIGVAAVAFLSRNK